MALLEVSHLVKHYEKPRGTFGALGRRPRQYVKAVDDISFSIEPGEMLALVGESGCGKTTTAETVLRVIEPTSGTVTLNGTDLTALSEAELRPLRRHMQIVYQDPYASLDPRFRVSRTIEEPLAIHGIGGSKRARRQLVSDALTQVELVPTNLFLDRFPHELSGGQRQRVAIATALAVNPELLIADEPVSMLDVSVRAGIMALLSRLCRERGMGILLITHDLGVAAHFTDRVAVMYLGRIVETGSTRAVLSGPPAAGRGRCHRHRGHRAGLQVQAALPVRDRCLRRGRPATAPGRGWGRPRDAGRPRGGVHSPRPVRVGAKCRSWPRIVATDPRRRAGKGAECQN
jgi:ABC-type oligopeptide transport system ATPase subunit